MITKAFYTSYTQRILFCYTVNIKRSRSWFMMMSCGLIVEYNPFHNVHYYHVEKAKELSQEDCMIAIMSGSFLQRGEPAIIDKYHRALAALKNGVDIVLELPYPYAFQSSHLFASGSVKILQEAG